MKKKNERFYRLENGVEYCFNVGVSESLTPAEVETLSWLLSETFALEKFGSTTFLKEDADNKIFEVGPLMNYATPWNTNALAICGACGLTKITRLERSTRTLIKKGSDTTKLFDRMTQGIYRKPLESFDTGRTPEDVYTIPMMEKGADALLEIPGLSMDEGDRQFYYHYFVEVEHRDPTIVEIMDLNNANSEHCRHGYFKGKQVIDGVEMPESLMDIVKSTLEANPSNSILAFRDNSSGIRGYNIETLVPEKPGETSSFKRKSVTYHFIFTAETHNFPTTIAPYPGAETGAGGRIRDIQATGRGGLTIAGTTGYFVGSLNIPGYELPWEKERVYPGNVASGLKVLIEGSNGASDYGNKFGEPVINGTAASVAIDLPDGTRQEYIKSILFTGGIGMLDSRHVEKNVAEPGMLIVQVGGPAYRIGKGGGSASSVNQGDNEEEVDFNAVQRGDGEMGQKVNRVIRACVEMGNDNPIVIVHDQGAGGPANVLKELVEKYGGQIDIRKIALGDPTLSILEIWICEFQERNGFIIDKSRITEFQAICDRENVNCEVLGEVTGDGYFVVSDSLKKDSFPVRLDLNQVLGGLPQKTFHDNHIKRMLKPLQLPANLTIEKALERVLKLVSVGSKDHLTVKVDRSVTGLIAQQQCCGPAQIPVSDYGVVAQSYLPDHFNDYTGCVTAIGEKHMEMMIDPQAAARMTIAEMLTNMAPALISGNGLEDIKISANWMWAPKLPGEGARLYNAATALRDMMIYLGIAIDGGKDSLSMSTKVKYPSGEVEIVKSPSQLILSGYATMSDITDKVTPDIKCHGESILVRVDLAKNKRRLGGSALAQVYEELGDEVPDIEPKDMKNGFMAIQKLVALDMLLSCHDISKGGLITTVLEMAFAGNSGVCLRYGKYDDKNLLEELFAEEAGWVIEILREDFDKVSGILARRNVNHYVIGDTIKENVASIICWGQGIAFYKKISDLYSLWHETSYELEKLQIPPSLATQKHQIRSAEHDKKYYLSFTPTPTSAHALDSLDKPKAAIIREEGSNGDREMTAAFYAAGFDVYDVTMSDLLADKADLADFQMVVFVGGFSYADVMDSAKGWAGVVRFNEKLKKMFQKFFDRSDTLSLGVCNGCQFEALTGLMYENLPDERQPRFIKNESGRFESHFLTVRIIDSPAVMFKDMEGSVLGVWSAHGEGKAYFPGKNFFRKLITSKLAPIRYVDNLGYPTEEYPSNPNGSPGGIAGLCSTNGRHLIMMPHPERSFLKWQLPYMPKEWHDSRIVPVSPWLKMFQNARDWCVGHKG